jgi:transposase
MSKSEFGDEVPAGLFDDLTSVQEQQVMAVKQARTARRQGPPRRLQPNRSQIELRASDLESLLGEDHRARLVWGYVERQDLSRLIESIKARGSNAGRSAIDPRILFALWLYATLEGVGRGREIARLTRESDAYRWICGGVEVSNAGSDMAQMAPMVEQVIERTGTVPGQWLVDGGFPAHEQIDAVHAHTQGQTEVIAPVPEPKRRAGKPASSHVGHSACGDQMLLRL